MFRQPCAANRCGPIFDIRGDTACALFCVPRDVQENLRIDVARHRSCCLKAVAKPAEAGWIIVDSSEPAVNGWPVSNQHR